MERSREEQRKGLAYLSSVTQLLDRFRLSDPTIGPYDAAEVHWWWAQNQRPTDDLGQLFWLDEDDRPVAAAIATDFGDVTQLAPIVLPGASPDDISHVMERGCEHAAARGITEVILEVDRGDAILRSDLEERGFAVEEDGFVECWMDADERLRVSAAPNGYRLSDRAESASSPHHMISEARGHGDPTERLQQSPIYRPELDICAYDESGNVAGYGLFWFNPTSGVGVVEPMRTEDDHQQRGIAHHILTTGLDRLAGAGATRLKVVFERGNPAAKSLYLGCGFQPHGETDLYAGPTSA